MIGDIFVFYPDKSNWFSCFIGGYIGGASHCGVKIVEIKTIPIIFEAVGEHNRVELNPLLIKEDRIYDIYRLKKEYRENFDLDKAIEWALKQVGKGYDYLQLIGIKLKRARFDSPYKYICSELVYNFFKEGGIELAEWKKKSFITPKDITEDPKLELIKGGKVEDNKNTT